MNRQTGRKVFSRVHGCLVMAAETAKGQGKQASSGATRRSTRRSGATAKLVHSWVLASMLLPSLGAPVQAMAQVRSDSSAPGNQRPTVLKSANGVVQVNVTTPSAAGVSRNQMSQMDVDRQGLILNNSRTHTQTQIGGYVQANPWLANGDARVLLMEVNSPQATSIQGFVEVAGRRSEVVIANPSGIFLNGAGFINTSRATLTTGEVQLQGGAISGYAVRGGTVTVGERGFDARATDFTSVLSRALVVSGPLHANELQVVTGNNQISVNSEVQGRSSASGAAPSVAIDVSELGGMYAGKITLISTEAGVGVSNAGQIQSGSGGLSLNANGDLVNTGAVASQGNLQFNSSTNITQAGQLAAANTANVVAAGRLSNTGTMSAGQVLRLEGNTLDTSGQLNAGELLHLKSAGAIRNSGDIVLQGRVQIEAGADISNTGLIHSQQSVRLTTPGNISNPGDMLAGGQLQWQASQDLNNSGRLEGQTGVNLQGRALTNTGEVVSGASLSAIASADVSNTGLVSSVGDMRIDSDGQLVNAASAALVAGGHAEWGARSAITNQGWMGAAGNATLSTSDEEGRIVSGRQSVLGAGLTADGVANLQKGHLNVQAGQSGDGSVQLQGLVRGGQKIEAQGGAVDIAGQDWLSQNIEVRATAGDVSAQGTRLVAKNALELSASQTLNTNQSHLGADALGVQATQWLANASLIEHSGTASDSVSLVADRAIELQGSWLGSNAQNLTLSSERIELQAAEVQHTGTGTLNIHSTGASALNLQTALVQSEGDFTLQAQALLAHESTLTAQGSLTVTATDGVAASDTLWAAGEQLTVTAGSVTAPRAQWFGVAQGVAVGAQGAVDLSAAQVQSEGDVRINAQGLNLGSAQVSGDAIELSAGQHTLSTRSAKVVAQADLDLQGQRLDNQSGVLQGLGVLSAQTTQDVNNQDAQMLSGQGLVIKASALNNAGGRIQSVGDVAVDVQTGAINNRAGLIASEKNLQIQAGELDNRQTQSTQASAKLGLQAAQIGVQAQTLNNQAGSVLAREAVALTLGQGVNNQGGIVSSQGDLQVQDRQSAAASRQLVIDNTQDGVLAANSQMRLAAKDLSNGGRVVLADTASPSESVLEVDLSGNWNNQAGAVLQSAQHLSLTVAGKVNNAGTVEAGQALEVQAEQWNNSAGSVLRSGSLLANVGSLSNQGLINSGELLLGANSVLNSEGGRVYGDRIVVSAGSLTNRGNGSVAPVIASRGDMDLAVGSVSNEEGALLLSLGDTRVGGEINAQGRATGMAGSFTNSSAEVDVMGNMVIQAQSVLNTDAHQHQYNITTVTDVEEYISMDEGHNFGKIHDATTGNMDWDFNSFGSERIATFRPFDGSGDTRANLWLIDEYVRTITESGSYGTDPARIGVGGNLTIAAGNTTNDKSTVVVGGQLNIQTGGFQNIDGYHTRSQDEVGTSQEAYTVRNLIGVHRRRFGPIEDRTFEMQTQYRVSGFDKSKQYLSVAQVPYSERNWFGVEKRETIVLSAPEVGGDALTVRLNNEVRTNTAPQHSSHAPAAVATVEVSSQARATGADNAGALQAAPALSGQAQVGKNPQVVRTLANGLPHGSGVLGHGVLTPGATITPPNSALYQLRARAPGGYVIETDPEFTQQRRWLGSDYMLAQMGYDPATQTQRLGDGFYEQRLVREQITAMSGQRFLGDHRNDEAQYRALLDAGAQFAKAHQLVPGVALSAAQMAELSSDMVWLVGQDLRMPDGSTQRVLVPQVYAVLDPSAPQRVAGLIGASGVNIEVDGSVFNSGTLAARDGLSLKAGDITNILGQITAGDVKVDASGSFHNILGDLAARQNLRLRAGGDMVMVGGRLSAGGNAELSAGGDLQLMAYDTGSRTSAQSKRDENGNAVGRGPKWSFENSTYQQTGVQIQTGGSLSAQAGGNLVAQGVQAQAGGATTLQAGGDMSLVTALQGHVKSFNHYQKDKTWGGLYNKATTIERRNIDLVNSGNTWDVASLDMSAGGKLVLQGAQVNAAKGISAYGGTGYEERAAYDVKETVNNVRTKRTGILAYAEGALTDVINRPFGVVVPVEVDILSNKMDVQTKDIDSTRKAKVTTLDGGGGSVQRSTGGDAFIEGSVVKGASVGTLTAGGKVTAVGAMDTRHVEKSTYSRSLFWQKTESEGYINQTLHLPKIHGLAPGAGAYQGAGGVSVQLPAGSSVRTQIEALSGQPGLEYLGELGQRSDIDWQRVEVINQSLNINKQGLTPEGVIVVAIAITMVLGPEAGMSWGQAALAAATATLATTATVSLINNGGDLGATLQELKSKETMRAVALSAATAGLTQGALEWANLSAASDGSNAAAVAKRTAELTKTGAQLARGTVQGLSAAMAESAILGTSFEEALGRHLTSSLIASLGAMGADEIGTHFDKTDALGNLNHKIAHAVLGCAMGAASADSSAGCAPGAVGAVIGELVAEWYAESTGYANLEQQRDAETDPIKRQALIKEVAAQKRLIIGISELAAVGGTAVLLQAGAEQLQLAKMTANNAVANNFLNHTESSRRLKLQTDQLACETDACRQEKQVEIDRLNRLDQWRDQQIEQACKSPASAACQSWTAAIQLSAKSYEGQYGNQVDTAERSSVLNQAYKYQQSVNNPFLHGVGTGLLKLTPPGVVVVGVGGVAATLDHIHERGLVDGMIDVLSGLSDIPQNVRDRLNSPDPTVRGEAFVDVLALGAGVGAVTAGGTRVALNQLEKSKLNSAIANAEAQAIARARTDNNFNADNDAFTLVSQQLQQAKSAGWLKPDGKTWWPPENGAVPGSQVQTTLPVGTKLDRYGGTTDKSTFLAPADTPMSARALKDVPDSSTRDMYEVLKPLPVQQSNTMPWFDQPGMGLQYDTSLGPKGLTIQKLVEQGYLKKVSP